MIYSYLCVFLCFSGKIPGELKINTKDIFKSLYYKYTLKRKGALIIYIFFG